MPSDRKKKSRRAKGAGSAPFKRADGRWSGYVSVGYQDGKPKRLYVYANSEREVVAKQNKLMSKSSSSVLPTRERLTAGQWFERYADEHGRERAERTKETYVAYLKHIIPQVGHIVLSKLNAIQLRVCMGKLVKVDGHPMSPSYKQHIFDFMNSALADALKLDLIDKNPMSAVERPRGGSIRTRDIWTREEARALIVASKAHPLGFMVQVCITLGLRIGEACALQWSDLTGSVLTISRTYNRAKTGGLYTVPKADSGGVIPLDPATVAGFAAQRERGAVRRALALEAGLWQEHDLIFASEVGTPVDPNNAARALDNLIVKAGIRRFSTHAMRRTYASFAAEHLPPKEIQERLRHKDIRMSLDVYTITMNSRKQKAALSLEQLLTPYDTSDEEDS
jgi:integrase